MASNVDGSVVLEVEMNVDDAEKELARLKAKIVKTETDLDTKKGEKNRLAAQFEDAKKEYVELSHSLRKFKGLSAAEFEVNPEVQKIVERMQELEKYTSRVESDMEKLDLDIDRSNTKLEATKETYGKIAVAAESLRNAGDAAEVGGGAQTKSLLNLSTEAAETAQRIAGLNEKLAELKEQQSQLGLALGTKAKAEFNGLAKQINAVEQEISDCEASLDQMAESGQLQNMADGAEIAKNRIGELSQYLEDLKAKQANLGLALGARKEYEELATEIERVKNLISAYEDNLANASFLNKMAEDAEVANQHIVDLREELARLKERQKELEGRGHGLGIQEYDDNAARIAEITAELKEYHKALTEAGAAEAGKNAPGGQLTAKLQAAQKMASILEKVSRTLSGSGSIAAEGAAAAEGLAGAAAGMEGLTAAAAAAGPVVSDGKLRRRERAE